jgi:hypothetical protein
VKTSTDITDDLDRLVQAHYYSEDFELIASLIAYRDGLAPDERIRLGEVALQRLMQQGTLVDILLCAVVQAPSAAPVLAGMLNREPVSNQITRALIVALRVYETDDAYTAVERFLDSDQELDALPALMDIDFRRTLPLVARMMKKAHVREMLVHHFHGRVKRVGLEGLVADFSQSSATRSPAFHDLLEKTLHSKPAPYNPFTPEQIMRILSLVRSA